MTDAPDSREIDCPSPEACDRSCDLHLAKRYDLTADEANAAVVGLYERLDETKRYIASEKRMIAAHEAHGDQCCAAGLDHWRESLAALEKRRDAIVSAIAKLEATA